MDIDSREHPIDRTSDNNEKVLAQPLFLDKGSSKDFLKVKTCFSTKCTLLKFFVKWYGKN